MMQQANAVAHTHCESAQVKQGRCHHHLWASSLLLNPSFANGPKQQFGNEDEQ